MSAPGGARLMLGFDGRRVDSELVGRLRRTGARAVILFARNLEGAPQARDLIAELRAAVDWPLLVAIDQEGGAVVRLTEGVTVFPGNMALGAAGDPGLARAQGRESGRQLAALGIDLNLAPVVDLQTNPANPGIGIRSFGDDRGQAAALATELVLGHAESGVAGCLKHFPGKGAAAVDAHFDLPVIDRALEDFYDPHVAVFRDVLERTAHVAPTPCVMTTHVVVTGVDPQAPATLSSRCVQELLRGRLGFEGLVIADDLEMRAVSDRWGIPEAAVLAARAGHDLLPISHSVDEQLAAAEALERALRDGTLDPQMHRSAVARIESYAGRNEPGDPVDPRDGDRIAARIARRSVHLFADPRGLLPLEPTGDVLCLVARPLGVSLVEEEAGSDLAATFRGLLREEGVRGVRALGFSPDLDPRARSALLRKAATRERIVLLSWNAHVFEGSRALLVEICRDFADRLIVCHLRNPFDQVFVPPGVTSLTAFGYRLCHLRALAAVLAGNLEPVGRMPARLR